MMEVLNEDDPLLERTARHRWQPFVRVHMCWVAEGYFGVTLTWDVGQLSSLHHALVCLTEHGWMWLAFVDTVA